jgi:hypothetical protein
MSKLLSEGAGGSFKALLPSSTNNVKNAAPAEWANEDGDDLASEMRASLG